MLCDWGTGANGEQVNFAARVMEMRSEWGTRSSGMVQTLIRVEYEVDSQRLWHQPSELAPLRVSTL